MYKGNGEQRILADGDGTSANPYVFVVDNHQQDRVSKTIILPMVEQIGSTTIAVECVKDVPTFTVASSAGMTVGNHIRIIDAAANRFYFGRILVIAGTLITVDSPVDYEYGVLSEVTYSNQNMAINGASGSRIFTLRTGVPSIPSTVHINRMIITCECTGAVSLAKFGDIAALTNGLLFRSVEADGTIRNIFNVKKVADLAGIAYDVTIYEASNPSQGRNGFAVRLSFNGDDKLGTTLQILSADNLEFHVHDNLSTLIELRVVLEGHVETFETTLPDVPN